MSPFRACHTVCRPNRPSCGRVGRFGRVLHVLTQGCYSPLQPIRSVCRRFRPPRFVFAYHLSTKTKTTTDLRSWSALVPVTPHGCAILHSPIHTVHGITNTSHPQICLSIPRLRRSWQHFLFPSIYEEVPTSKYKSRANGNRARNRLAKSSAHPDSRLEEGNVARGD